MSRKPRLFLVCLLAGVLVLYAARLDYSPPALYSAEVLFALHAHSIATTGHDIYGRFMPLYFQMRPIGENVWFHPVVVYFTALFLVVLPVSESAIRLPSVFAGLTNIILIYLIAKRMFGRGRLALLASALLALTPAHFIHSRLAMDYLYPVPFVLAWLLLLLIFIERKALWILFVATSFLGVGVYSYIASVIMMPVYLLMTWLALWMTGRRPRRPYVVAAVGFAWPLLILAVWLFYHPAVIAETLGRYGIRGTIPTEGGAASTLGTLLEELRRPVRFSSITGRLSLYWYFFDPSFLFLTGGYANVVNSTRHVGVFPLPFLVLLPVGLVLIAVRRQAPVNLLVLLGLVSAPLAACLVVPEPYAIDREMALVPFGVLIAVFGVAHMLASDRRWHRMAGIGLLAATPLHFAFFWVDYFGDYRGRSAFWFEFNHRGALEEVIAREAQEHPPAIYLSRGHDPYIEPYWQLSLIKHHREDLLQRTVYFDAGSLDIQTVPAGSLLVVNRNDVPIDALVAAGTLHRLALIPEPADPPYFSVLRR